MGGIDRVLEDVCFVLTADHSQSDVAADESAAIQLEDLLTGFRCAQPGTGWQEGDELMLCPNMRPAEVYLRSPTNSNVRRVCNALLEDRRIDHVIWRSHDDREHVVVATRERGSLDLRAAPDDAGAVEDEYGGRWEIRGEPGALDVSIHAGRVQYGSYPNALERVANGIDEARAGRLWVTAQPTYEFRLPGQSVHHGGGSHGTLHELDSLVPLLMAGHPANRDCRAPRGLLMWRPSERRSSGCRLRPARVRATVDSLGCALQLWNPACTIRPWK